MLSYTIPCPKVLISQLPYALYNNEYYLYCLVFLFDNWNLNQPSQSVREQFCREKHFQRLRLTMEWRQKRRMELGRCTISSDNRVKVNRRTLISKHSHSSKHTNASLISTWLQGVSVRTAEGNTPWLWFRCMLEKYWILWEARGNNEKLTFHKTTTLLYVGLSFFKV